VRPPPPAAFLHNAMTMRRHLLPGAAVVRRSTPSVASACLDGRSHTRLMTTCLQSSGKHHSAAACLVGSHSSRRLLPLPAVSVSWPACVSARRAASSASVPRSKTPTLNATLRRFYFLVHPDLFHSHPLHRSVNEANLQHFLGFVTAMKQTSSAEPWPPARHTNLTFYIRRKARDAINTQLSFIDYCEQREQGRKGRKTPAAGRRGGAPDAAKGREEMTTGRRGGAGGRHEDSEFHVLRVTLSTNGGSCRAMVERQLRHLFCMAALPEEFVWDDEYWQQKAPISRTEAEGEEEQQGDGWGFADDEQEPSAQRERDRA
jgi:hypothetical protein